MHNHHMIVQKKLKRIYSYIYLSHCTAGTVWEVWHRGNISWWRSRLTHYKYLVNDLCDLVLGSSFFVWSIPITRRLCEHIQEVFTKLQQKASSYALRSLCGYICSTWIVSTVFSPPLPNDGQSSTRVSGKILMWRVGTYIWIIEQEMVTHLFPY